MNTRSNKANKVTFVPKSRGSYQKTSHSFPLKEIEGPPVYNKDVLGQIFYLREMATNNKEPKKKTCDLVKTVIQHLEILQIPHILSYRQLQLNIKQMFDTYQHFLKHPDRKIAEREQFLDNLAYVVRKTVPENIEMDYLEEPDDMRDDVSSLRDEPDDMRDDVSSFWDDPRDGDYDPLIEFDQSIASSSADFLPSPSQNNNGEHDENTTDVVNNRNLSDITVVCELALRYGTNFSVTAALSTGTLAAHKIVTPENRTEIIDRKKVERQTEKLISDAKTMNQKEFAETNNFYFDSKKIEGKAPDGSIERQNMYVFVQGNGKFMFTEISDGEDAKSSVEMIKNTFTRRELELSKIYLLGADGTNVNTGHKTGIIRQLEEYVGHPIQWIICLLHSNELPLRHLFGKLDGGTSGPKSFVGPIGKRIAVKGFLNTLPIVKFKQIDCDDLPPIDRHGLSKDQQYLLDIFNAIKQGYVSESVARRVVGTLHHARFLNLASSICRLYVSDAAPSKELVILVKYVLQVYVPCYFAIKTKSKIHDAARNLFIMFKGIKAMPTDLYEFLLPVILNNNYAFHPENLLLAMITDEDKNIRDAAFEKIITARAEERPMVIRTFRKPKREQINEIAEYYCDILNWDLIEVTPPPIFSQLSNDELQAMADDPEIGKEWLNYLNHTQHVERGIKDITFISKRHPPEDRDAVMKVIVASREKMPCFHSKKDFNVFTSSLHELANQENCDYEDEYDAIDMEEELLQDFNNYEDGLTTDESDSEMDIN